MTAEAIAHVGPPRAATRLCARQRELFDLVGFGGHEDIIGFIVCAEGVWSGVEVIHGIDVPAIGNPDANTRKKGKNNEDPKRARCVHRKCPGR